MVLKSAEHSSVMADSFLKSDNQQMNKLIKKLPIIKSLIGYSIVNLLSGYSFLKKLQLVLNKLSRQCSLNKIQLLESGFFGGGGMPIECWLKSSNKWIQLIINEWSTRGWVVQVEEQRASFSIWFSILHKRFCWD